MMMHVEKVNLYDHFGLPCPEHGRGELTCLCLHTPGEMHCTRRRPAVLVIPGGAYKMNSQREAEPIALRFMNRGYVAFVLQYAVKPAVFPTALREAALAMRYIRENCDAFEVDPKMVAAIGFSAGGHLCGTLGTMYDCPEVADIGPGGLLRPDALGLCYPVAVGWGHTHTGSFQNISGGDEKLIERLSIDKRVRPDMPPVYIWHTRDDQGVPVRNSLVLSEALAEAGVDFAMQICHSGKHGLATADLLAYTTHKMPPISSDIPGWEDRMIAFFGECGLTIQDEVEG